MTPLTGSTLPRGIAVGNLLAGRSTYLVRENALPDFFTFPFLPQLPLILYSYVLMCMCAGWFIWSMQPFVDIEKKLCFSEVYTAAELLI